jgi:hypothetical protein
LGAAVFEFRRAREKVEPRQYSSLNCDARGNVIFLQRLATAAQRQSQQFRAIVAAHRDSGGG